MITNGRGEATTQSCPTMIPDVETSRTGRLSAKGRASTVTPLSANRGRPTSTTVATTPTFPKDQGRLRLLFFAKMALTSDTALSAAVDAKPDRVIASFETLVASWAASTASLAILTNFSSASERTLIWLPTPLDTFWPVCFVKKRMKAAEMAEL